MAQYPHIQLLPAYVANKIAAGEVVERPASVLKELMENAVDAGATEIKAEVTAGGRKLVAVTDNGAGMTRDDAILSIERHATSKIRDVDDIEHISTLGFRGEALAAIAAVSRFRMVTAAEGSESGTEMLISAGKIQDIRDIGCPRGTCIEVRDLFFNTPARRKFLRSHDTELAHLRSLFMVQALSHPAVGMSLSIDGRESWRLPQGDGLEDRLRQLFGRGYSEKLRPIEPGDGPVKVRGFAAVPDHNRADRNEQYVFVNGRVTSAPAIGYAIREAYRTLLPSDRNPIVFLFIELDPGSVDVNVHPTKREVRFRRTDEVRDAVITALRRALRLDPATKAPAAAVGPGGAVSGSGPSLPRAAAEIRLLIEDLPQTRTFKYPRLDPAQAWTPDRRKTEEAAGARSTVPVAESAGKDKPDGGGGFTAPWSVCRVLGQAGSLYVVLETEDGIVIMDPHAAHERVLFERFMTNVLDGRVAQQALLIPQTVEMSPDDAAILRKTIPELKSMGFGISEFGGDSFVVDALPSSFAGLDARSLLIEIGHSIEQAGARHGRSHALQEAIAQAACKAAVKARNRLTLQEIEQLVVDLGGTEMPYTCPHGRPTMIFMSFAELNRKFGRQ